MTDTFETWCDRLAEAHERMRQTQGIEGYGPDIFDVTGRDYWRQYFDEKETPETALAGDQQYWGLDA
jgi:hypothetical protein